MKNFFLCILALAMTSLFVSCKNFLNAKDIKTEIEEAIEIANSSPVTYYVIADNNSGTVTPTQLRLKKKEKFDVMFIPEDGWQFVCWEVLDRSTGEPVSDSIKFDEPEKLETRGSVLEAKENLVIHPKCRLVPKVLNISPAFESYGCNQDTTIVVKFNKPMNPDTFGDFNCVSVTCSEMPLYTSTLADSYFQTPSFSSDNTELLIPTVKGKFILPESSTKSLLDINLDIDLSEVKDMDGKSLTENISYTYRINKNKDGIAPEVSDLKVFKPVMDKTTETGDYTQISDKKISEFINSENYIENTYVLNHVGSKIYFDTTVIDDDSGFMQLTIKETLKATVDSVGASLTPKVSKPYKSSSFTDNSLKKALYELQSEFDGLVQLDFIFIDYANNETVLTRYVVKDTSLAAAQVINPKSVSFSRVTGETMTGIDGKTKDSGFYFQLSDNTLQTVEAHTPTDGMLNESLDFSNCNDFFYFSKNPSAVTKSIVNYDVKFGYSASSINSPATKESDKVFTFTRDVSKDCYLQMTAWDDVGNTSSIIRVIPRQVSIINMVESSGTNISYTFSISNEDALSALVKQYSAQRSTFVVLYKFKPKGSSSISNNFRYALIDKTMVSFSLPNTEKFYLSTSTFADDTLTPDGTYYFYVIPIFRYGRDIWFTGAVSTEPYVFYHNVNPPSSSGSPNFGQFNVSTPIKDQNTGVHEYTVTKKTNWTSTSGWTYGVCYYKTGITPPDYRYTDWNFSVPSGNKYQLCLYAKNKTTGTVVRGSTVTTIDATYDNIPPIIIPSFDVATNYDELKCAPNQILLGPKYYPQDIGSAGLPKEDDDSEYFSYYILKKEINGTIQSIANTITWEDVEDLEPEWGIVRNNCINLPLEKFIEGAYTIVFNLEDNNDNSALHSFTIYNKTNSEIPVPVKKGSILYFNNNSGTNTMTYAFGYYYDDDGMWKKINGSNDTFPNNPTNSYSQVTDKFVKFTEFDSNNYVYSMTCFYSSDYLNKLASGQSVTCNSKGLVPGFGNNIQIFYDAPYFVHTMKYPKDKVLELETKARSVSSYNDITYDEALAYVWATKGIEIDSKYESKAFDGELKSSNYTIPVGSDNFYAYAAVVHFADGTTMMSDVRNK